MNSLLIEFIIECRAIATAVQHAGRRHNSEYSSECAIDSIPSCLPMMMKSCLVVQEPKVALIRI